MQNQWQEIIQVNLLQGRGAPVSLKVVILEDRAADVDSMLYEVRQAGFAPDGVHVESEADYLAQLEPSFHVILADYALPWFDVLRALALLQARKLDIPFIIVSANIREDRAVSAMKQGTADHQLKDCLARLGQAVTQELEQKQQQCEKQQAEAALRESDDRFRATFEQAAVGMALVGLDGRLLQVNQKLCDFAGFSRAELLTRTSADITHPDDRQADLEYRRKLLAGEIQSYAFEKRFLRRDGSYFCVNLTRSLAHQISGEPAYFIGVFEDISERKRAETELRESEEHYRLLFDSNPHPMWVYDVATLAFLAVNDAAVHHYGYTRAEFLSLTIKDILLPADLPLLLKYIKRRAASAFDSSGTWRHRKKDGTTIEIEITSHPLIFGGHAAHLVLANDVSERAQVETERMQLHIEIEKSAVEWQMTFDAIESPVLILDGEDCITRLNYAAKQLAGGADVVGRTIGGLGSSTIWQTATVLAGLIRQTRTSHTYQARDEASGRTWDLAASLADRLDGHGEYIILMIREITSLVELQASLHRSETMSLLGALVSGVAHEVRNPLFGISSTLDAFEARFGAAEEYQRYLSVLHNQVNRLNDLMKDLLDYGTPPNRQLERGSIAEVIAQAVIACTLQAERAEVQVVSQVDAKLPTIQLDANRLLQVFLNLLENAIQLLPAGGVITVAAEEVSLVIGHWIVCTVKDTGPGFQENDLPRLFEPFFTRRGGGTGLGLSIVQKIVEEHGGKISAGNLPEGGAAVSLRFPVSATA